MIAKEAFRLAAVAVVFTACAGLQAANVTCVDVPSAAMGRTIPVSIITPDGYDPAGTSRYCVVYMLHGAGDNHTTWADAVGRRGADECRFIGVCPDGDKTCWWYDSPVNPKSRFETFVSRELVAWIDANCRTVAERRGRAITGGSMGGHGACWLGFRHRDVFGAIGNIYGGVDVRRHTRGWKPWGLDRCLGAYEADKALWDAHMCMTEAAKLRNGDVNLLTVVGTGDFFLEDNRAMHDILARNKVAHFYLEVRGEDDKTSCHTHPFRHLAEPIVFRFFRNYFETGKASL